jgi:hypothetical protein
VVCWSSSYNRKKAGAAAEYQNSQDSGKIEYIFRHAYHSKSQESVLTVERQLIPQMIRSLPLKFKRSRKLPISMYMVLRHAFKTMAFLGTSWSSWWPANRYIMFVEASLLSKPWLVDWSCPVRVASAFRKAGRYRRAPAAWVKRPMENTVACKAPRQDRQTTQA